VRFDNAFADGQAVSKIDNPFKILIMLGCMISVAWSFSTGRLDEAPWVNYKILVFVWIVFCSLIPACCSA
jgi:hypothetical protein